LKIESVGAIGVVAPAGSYTSMDVFF